MRFTAALDVDGAIRAGATVTASLKTEFLEEAHYPNDLTMGVGFIRIGRTSWTLIEGAFHRDRCVALCEVVVVRLIDKVPSETPEQWRMQASTFSIAGLADQT